MLMSIMYHYVHNKDDNGIFKNLKGITTEEFEHQIQYLLEKFIPISHNDLVNHFKLNQPLSEKSFYLTFDDGFKQHIDNVLPILKKYNLTASFYIPTMPLEDKKIHFLEKQRVCQYAIQNNYIDFLNIFYEVAKNFVDKKKLSFLKPNTNNIQNAQDYLAQYSFYTKEERFYRKNRDILLTLNEVSKIIDEIFYLYFNETNFIKDYYMNLEDLRQLKDNDMIIGGHSYSHPYLDRIRPSEMQKEIDRGMLFLRDNVSTKINSFSYPYGTYNDDVKNYLKKQNIDYAFTTKDKINKSMLERYELMRIDASNFSMDLCK